MDWSRKVYRLRELPATIESEDGVARLLSERLSDVSLVHIHVKSLATNMKVYDFSTKVATVMFSVTPSLITQGDQDQSEWNIPAKGHDDKSRDLILDTHFMGLTPMNDTAPLPSSCDCIAVSGLASHAFGSWQPKGDKQFMWIRDNLPKLRGARAILYGYDTRLSDNSSFQNINDLAKHFVGQLQACRKPGTKTPLVFLAHSLGGLVVKQALRTLAEHPSDEDYTNLLSVVRGAIFFGVPNYGMEQGELHAIFQDDPNGVLIRELSPRSNFILQLNRAFLTIPRLKSCKIFWAYETQESPTTIKKPNGELSRDGPPAILVSPESATCGFIHKQNPVTFSINATHSNMVKFERSSSEWDIVYVLLSKIFRSSLQMLEDSRSDLQCETVPNIVPDQVGQPTNEVDSQHAMGRPVGNSNQSLARSIFAELDKFKRMSSLTENEEETFMRTTFDVVKDAIGNIQRKQEISTGMMYMRRLEPFLISMEQFGNLAANMELFSHAQAPIAYVWGPLRYIIETVYSCPPEYTNKIARHQAMNCILSAYEEIGQEIPQSQGREALFVSRPYFRDVLVIIYKDILSFHAQVIRHLKRRQWVELFNAWWMDFGPTVDAIVRRIGTNRRIIENEQSLTIFEEIRQNYLSVERQLERERKERTIENTESVNRWLSAVNHEEEQAIKRRVRQDYKDSGAWLLEDSKFQQWASPNNPFSSLLWLSGIPGAGKTILASIVIDKLSETPGANVAFFYCKYGEKRNSVESVIRSILAQLLAQNPDLLPYFHDIYNKTASSTSPSVSKELLRVILGEFSKVYIVIDGLDECGRDARRDITTFFHLMVNEATEVGSVRCLFVSQDDGHAAEDFIGIPAIRIGDRNRGDISNFASARHQEIVNRFGSTNYDIQAIITHRANGMFIFADLFASYLKGLKSIREVENQLSPDNMPVELDNLYDRIIDRIREDRGADMMKFIEEMLGWIVCARRPLRWGEIQTAICTCTETQSFDVQQQLAWSPRELFASLIECRGDGTVELVHGTARQYLTKTKSVSEGASGRTSLIRLNKAHFSLGLRCLTYLALPQFDCGREEKVIRSDLLSGFYQLHDYATACWALHLEGLAELKKKDATRLRQALTNLVGLRWSESYKPLPNVQRVRKRLSPLERPEDEESMEYNQLVQAVACAQKQSGPSGKGPSDAEEALTLWKATKAIRSVLETFSGNEDELKIIKELYGTNRFKCPRINCISYHQGFPISKDRKRHVGNHDRHFRCSVPGCLMGVFGFALETDLQNHLSRTHCIPQANKSEEPPYPKPRKDKRKTPKSGQGEHEFKCPVCDKTYSQKKSLNRHTNRHQGQSSFPCEVCHKSFSRKHKRDAHLRLKHFICRGLLRDGTPVGCNKPFGSKSLLKDHWEGDGAMCVYAFSLQNQQAGKSAGESDNAVMLAKPPGANQADMLLAAKRSLPPFQTLLEWCGLADRGTGSFSRVATPVPDEN